MAPGSTGKTYQTTQAGTNVEDTPEPSKVPTLGLFGRVGHHNGALRSPQQTGAHSQKGARKDIEAGDIFVDRNQQGDRIETVADTSK